MFRDTHSTTAHLSEATSPVPELQWMPELGAFVLPLSIVSCDNTLTTGTLPTDPNLSDTTFYTWNGQVFDPTDMTIETIRAADSNFRCIAAHLSHGLTTNPHDMVDMRWHAT